MSRSGRTGSASGSVAAVRRSRPRSRPAVTISIDGPPPEHASTSTGGSSARRRSIGTRRAASPAILIGSSTLSRPSSNVARARSASTSTPSSTARRKLPVGISTCW